MAGMSVVSLNVNGLRDHRKHRLLFDFLKYEKFDVIFLQETHIATVEDCKIGNERVLESWLVK
jgi:exonuclease III